MRLEKFEQGEYLVNVEFLRFLVLGVEWHVVPKAHAFTGQAFDTAHQRGTARLPFRGGGHGRCAVVAGASSELDDVLLEKATQREEHVVLHRLPYTRQTERKQSRHRAALPRGTAGRVVLSFSPGVR